MYLLGFDIGSSSIKAALVDASTGRAIKVVHSPNTELNISSRQEGWAEQDPEIWWQHVCLASNKLLQNLNIDLSDIKSIGISYQMHGLVLVDKNLEVLRPSIIWCDSRAVEIGNEAFTKIGPDKCLSHCLNSPGNFTASKLKWVKDNEPQVFNRIYKMMLPGDYIGMKMTGIISTTISGLSEGVMWDFKSHQIAASVLNYFGISENCVPEIKETFSVQGELTGSAADLLGLKAGIPIGYRAGDQPNNAMSLGVFEPNEVAATGGTSGVVYGVTDSYKYDLDSRVNGFAHVNHSQEQPRIGQLLCINGAGSQYAWMKNQVAQADISYDDMEKLVAEVAVGSDGLRILPFGNGAERMIRNVAPGAQVNNLQFNRHTKSHFFRASLEGIAFSFIYGFEILKKLGLDTKVIKVGNDNLFQSPVFSQTITSMLGCNIEVIDTTGAIGAAKASGIAVGIYKDLREAFSENKIIKIYSPKNVNGEYEHAFNVWEEDLNKLINN